MGVLWSFYAHTRRPTLSSSLQNGSQGDFPTRGRAEPLKPTGIRLLRGVCPREATRVSNYQGQEQLCAGVAERTCRPRALPAPGRNRARSSSPALAQPAGRRPGTDSPPGPSGRVQPAKFLLQGRALVPVLLTGRLCCPGGAGTSLLPLLQGGTAAPRPFLSAFPVAPARRVNARAPRAPRGSRPTGRRLPWRPPCFAPGAGGCGTLSPARWRCGSGPLTSRPDGGGSGDTAWQRARPACLPTPSRRRGSCGRRQPIGWARLGPPGRA